MSYRYLRHGLLTRRTPLSKSGFEPFVDNLMWDVTRYHYGQYMSKVAQCNIMGNQRGIETIMGAMGSSPPYLRTCIPQITPFHRQSNPFCPHSANATGFEAMHRRLMRQRTRRGKRIAIDDISRPMYPKHF